MNEELELKLYKKYPNIFKDTNKSPQESCMAFGLEVGDGWYNLIDYLCEALTYTFTTSVEIDEEDGKSLGIEPSKWNGQKDRYFFKVEPPQVIASQVKEKFGTLRFYYRLEYDENNVKLSEKYADLKEVNKRYSDYIDGIVHFAEIASGHTCEQTGDKGQLYVRNGWLKVLSEAKAKELGYKPFNETHETKD